MCYRTSKQSSFDAIAGIEHMEKQNEHKLEMTAMIICWSHF